LLLAAVVIALMTATAVGYLIWSRPLHLRVARGRRQGTDALILTAFDRLLEVNKASVRLDLVTTAGLHENQVALEKREVDLAVVRVDDPLHTAASLIALLRINVVIAVAPSRASATHLPRIHSGWRMNKSRRGDTCNAKRAARHRGGGGRERPNAREGVPVSAHGNLSLHNLLFRADRNAATLSDIDRRFDR
jgi:hypothetical protein